MLLQQLSRLALSAALALFCVRAYSWGPDGHHTVGALADRLLAGTHAETQVRSILGDLSLEQASVWADCAKGVDPNKGFAYTAEGKYAECAIYETPELEAEMIDFVKRNDTNCPRIPGDESCHKQYHYTDEAVQQGYYHQGDVGTRPFDVVAAISACIEVLQGKPAPPPFDIKSQREALLLLTHYVGDIHQPLHVGAVYLDASGVRVNPNAGPFNAATETRGANDIVTVNEATNRRSANMHATWDDIPEALNASHVDQAWLRTAKGLTKTKGPTGEWPTQWANATLAQARRAFAGLTFGAEQKGQWAVTLTCAYDAKMGLIKKKQLTAAGARLAQVLQGVWP